MGYQNILIIMPLYLPFLYFLLNNLASRTKVLVILNQVLVSVFRDNGAVLEPNIELHR